MHLRFSTSRRNGRIHRYAQLVESYRRPADGMPAHRVLVNLGVLSDCEIENLRAALAASRKNQRVVVASARPSTFRVIDNLEYLALAVALEMWRRLQLPTLLEELLGGFGADAVAALSLQRLVDPGSKLYAQRWYPRTALPELLGMAPAQFNNTQIHRVLTSLERISDELQVRLPQRYQARDGAFSALFIDVTDTWFVGHGPDLAQRRKTKEGLVKSAVGIVLLCNDRGYPLRWQVIGGKEPEGPAMSAVMQSLAELDWAREVPVVCDRAMGRTAYLRELLKTGIRFVTALTVAEFDAYSGGRIPHDAVSTIDATAKDAPKRAAEAVRHAGMQRVAENMYVLDLGVVERHEGADVDDDAPPPPSRARGHDVSEALELSRALHAEVEAGRSLRAAAKTLGLAQQRAVEIHRLHDLVPELQDEITSAGSSVSMTRLVAIAKLAPLAQRTAYERDRTSRRREAHVVPPAQGAPAEEVRVRAVMCFNPQQFVDQRLLADRELAAVESFVRSLNERLRRTRVRRRAEAIYAEVDRELRRRFLVDAFDIHVEDSAPQKVKVDLKPAEWARRRRFDGFWLLVAHPDCLRSAAELAKLYRAKDAVEKDFHIIKSVVELRPVWHRTDLKVRAHVTLCMLALLVERALEQALADTPFAPISADSLLELLANVHLNRVCAADKSTVLYTVTEAKEDQLALLRALGIQHLVDEGEIQAHLHPR